MTHTQTTAARDAAPASRGAHGAARGSSIAETLDLNNPRRHQEPTLGSVISR